MKSINFSVRRNVPTFGQTGNRARRPGIQPRQTFKHPLHRTHFGLAGDDGRVEGFRLAPVDDGEVSGGFTPTAAHNQQAGDEAKRKARPRIKSPGAFGNGHRVTSIGSERRARSCPPSPAARANYWSP